MKVWIVYRVDPRFPKVDVKVGRQYFSGFGHPESRFPNEEIWGRGRLEYWRIEDAISTALRVGGAVEEMVLP